MNITQATTATTAAVRKVGRRTAQPKTATRLGAFAFGFLSYLAQLNYDLGPLSVIIKPEWKPYVTAISGVAGLILFAMGEYMPTRPTEPKPTKESHEK